MLSMGRTSGTVTVKTENSINISWNSVQGWKIANDHRDFKKNYFTYLSSYLQHTVAFEDFTERISDAKNRRRQSYLDIDSQKMLSMGRTSGTVTVKTENSINISWNSV